jgi:hypothetical protein
MDGSREAIPGKDGEIPMLMFKGVAYGPCCFCDDWFPIEEQSWSYELQGWVCYEHILFSRRDR